MAAVNNIVTEVAKKSIFNSAKALITSAVSFAQGDLLILDTTNHILAAPSAETDGAVFLGVATETVVSGLLKRPYTTDVDASAAITDVPGPVFGVIAKLVSKTADAWVPGNLVYLDPATGTRGVSSTGTKAIGVYQGKAITSATAGQEIEVLVGARFGGDVLKF